MKTTYRKALIISALVIACSIIVCAAYLIIRSSQGVSIDPNTYYPVVYVIDGDTFKARIGRKVVTVRELGVNTPETVDPRKKPECFGKEASDESKSLLAGRKVKLVFNPNREQKDKYGRYLAYTYRDDGLFVNGSLLENGFAREYTFGTPYSMQKEFRSLESAAKNSRKGLWGICP